MPITYAPVPIISCHHCRPDKWEVIGEARYEYKCTGCKTTVKKVLREKKE